MSRPFSFEEQRWLRAIAYWGHASYNDPQETGAAMQMARTTKREPHQIFVQIWKMRRALELGLEPRRYPDRLTDGVYYENGLLFREVMTPLYAAAESRRGSTIST